VRLYLYIYLPELTFRAEKFSKRLFGLNRLNDALQQLENVRAEEALMAGAEPLEIAARIDKTVAGIDKGVQDGHVMMSSMTGQLQSAQADIQGVGTKFVRCMQVTYSFFASPRMRPQPYPVRCNGGQRRDARGA
jgi:hypothetical protein